MRTRVWAALALGLPAALFGAALFAAEEPLPHRQERPPNRPYSPEEAIRRMTVPEGFRVELVAAEPDLVNPVAMTFDDRGRIWIAESLEYPRKEAGEGRDRIKVLEDTDGDGRADRFTVFAAGLNIPTGIAVGHGGVWVMNAPDLIFFREQDGREAGREVVLTGFGRTDTHELPNSLTWGPDGWLYGLNGVFNQCRVVSGGKRFDFTCGMFRLHPRSRRFEVFSEGTSNPWGLIWDGEGSALVSACHWANDHLFHFVETGYYQRQAGAYPPYSVRIGSVTTHSHQKTAYCGLAWYDSEVYPERFRERLYLGNIHGNCINVDQLSRDGSTYLSSAEPDFLSANDAWFMPVSQQVGPDGCLYVLDWYDRYHCYQDANRDPAGVDRLKGRLYRVRYRDSPRAAPFDLARESDDRLVERLSGPDLFFRERAQRILAERAGPSLADRLGKLVLDGDLPRKARLHALWSLISAGPLEPGLHLRLLDHPDPAFRAWAVRAAGNQGSVTPALRSRVAALAREPSPDALLQVAIASRKIEGLDPLPVLTEVLMTAGQDKLIPSIVWQNLHPLLGEAAGSGRFARLVGSAALERHPALASLLPRAVDRILSGSSPGIEEAARLLDTAAERDPEIARQCFSRVSAKLSEEGWPGRVALARATGPLVHRILSAGPERPLYRSAQLLGFQLAALAGSKAGLAVDPESVRKDLESADRPPEDRLAALDALIAFRDPLLPEALGRLLPASSPEFGARVLASLGRLEDPKLADLALSLFPKLDPELRPLLIDLLLTRERWARKLLDAVVAKQVPGASLDANHLRKILESNDREAVWLVERVFGTVRSERNPERERVVEEMGRYLRGNPGRPAHGEAVFRRLCGQCHQIHGRGQKVGPDLTASGRATFDQLLTSVFDPSLVIGPGYQTTTVVTRDGRSLTGLVVEDGGERVVLRMQGGTEEAVPRGNVKYLRASKLSMMPEGIETILTKEELSDLFAFLSLDRPPGDPQARPIPGAP